MDRPKRMPNKKRGQPGLDDATGLGAQYAYTPTPLENHHQHAVGRAHGEKVEYDGLQRNHYGAEHYQEQQEGQPSTNAKT